MAQYAWVRSLTVVCVAACRYNREGDLLVTCAKVWLGCIMGALCPWPGCLCLACLGWVGCRRVDLQTMASCWQPPGCWSLTCASAAVLDMKSWPMM